MADDDSADVPLTWRQSLVVGLLSLAISTAIGGVSAAVGGVGGFVLRLVALLAMTVALTCLKDAYLDRGDPADRDSRLRRMYAAGAALALVFFAGAGSFLGWVFLDPDSGCVDCDDPGSRATGWAAVVIGWTFGAWLARSTWRRRPSAQHGAPYDG